MQIYVLRHGIAADTQPDAERALTAEGREKLARVLRHAGISPSLILSSPYRRAIETAGVAADLAGYKGEIVRTQALVPEASPHAAWDEIRAHKAESAILLATHQPLAGVLAAFLLGYPGLEIEMKKAAVVRVECERFGAQPRGVLKWMLTPAVAGE